MVTHPASVSVMSPKYRLTRALLAYWATEDRAVFDHLMALDKGRRAAGIPSYRE